MGQWWRQRLQKPALPPPFSIPLHPPARATGTRRQAHTGRGRAPHPMGAGVLPSVPEGGVRARAPSRLARPEHHASLAGPSRATWCPPQPITLPLGPRRLAVAPAPHAQCRARRIAQAALACVNGSDWWVVSRPPTQAARGKDRSGSAQGPDGPAGRDRRRRGSPAPPHLGPRPVPAATQARPGSPPPLRLLPAPTRAGPRRSSRRRWTPRQWLRALPGAGERQRGPSPPARRCCAKSPAARV